MNRSISAFRTRRVCFRRWGNKSYSVFASLKVLVKVSVLSTSYSLLAMPVVVNAQTDTISFNTNVDIDEVVISTPQTASTYSELMRVVTVVTKDEFSQLPVNNLHELLQSIASVDIRQRGGHGVQADLMVRGGSFDQVLILLNGVNITDPQTGHHSLNIPIDIESVERIELLQGPGARIYGPGSFSGAINIITSSKGNKYAQVKATAGEYGLLKTNASTAFRLRKANIFVATSASKSDGYINNTDFNIHNLFAHSQVETAVGEIDFQAGYQDKAFGAQGFYTPKYPEQFEQTATFFSSISLSKRTKRLTITPSLYFRNHNDRFELFRKQSPDWYQGHNYHNTLVWGGKIGANSLNRFGKTRAGTEFRSEQILSNVLGTPLLSPKPINNLTHTSYTHSHSRNLLNLFVDHTLYLDRLIISAGGSVSRSSTFGLSWNFGFDLSYRLWSKAYLYSSLGNATRYPTFTDLFYDGPTNQGNINLKPEYANNYEIGLKLKGSTVNANASGFHRRATDVIDWVKNIDEEQWQTMNHTQINTSGFDIQTQIIKLASIPKLKSIAVGYTFLYANKETKNLQSYYALDHLKHKVTTTLNHSIIRNINASWTVQWQDRAGGYTAYPENIETPYTPFALINLRVYAELNDFLAYIDVFNLSNKSFVEHGNIEQPGRWISIGFKHALNFPHD